MPSTEFEQATITTRRREAANLIGHFYRQKKALQASYFAIRAKFQDYRDQKSNLSAQAHEKILDDILQLDKKYLKNIMTYHLKTEMILKRKLIVRQSKNFNEMIHQHVQASNYHLIDFHHPDFVQHLFGAFYLSLLNMNDMISIKLIYDALLCFRRGQLPEKASQELKRYHITQGPFKPESIDYWFKKHSQALEQKLLESSHPEKYHYYTLAMEATHIEFFLFECLKKNFIPPYFSKLLLAYIQQKEPNCEDISNIAIQYLKKQDSNLQEKLIAQLFDNKRPRVSLKEKDSILFLIAVEQIQSQFPSIIAQPNDKNLIEFIIPSIDCLNIMQDILHGKEAVYPCGVVGKQTPKLIRAFDEIPSLSAGQKLSPAQENLKALYPISQTFDGPRRPVEITYPNIPSLDNPHDFKPHDFMLLWHDLFHAWRSGSNYKRMIRKLRLLHDEKFGYSTHSSSGMSPAIWTLTDMDTSTGLIYRERETINAYFLSFQVLIEQMVYQSKEPHQPENYLFIIAYVKNPSQWEPLPFIKTLKAIAPKLQHNPAPSLQKFYETYLEVFNYNSLRPVACFFEIYLACVLKPQANLEIKILENLSDEICQNIFQWQQDGIEFKDESYQSCMQMLGLSRDLVSNLEHPHLVFIGLTLYLIVKHPEVSIPADMLLAYFDDQAEMGLEILCRFNHQYLQAWVQVLLNPNEHIPELFFIIILEQDLTFILWNEIHQHPHHPIQWQINCIQDEHYIYHEDHAEYLFQLYQAAIEHELPYQKLEFLLLQSQQGFVKLIQQARPELLNSFIDQIKHADIDIKKQIFFGYFDETYYILKKQIRVPDQVILELCQKFPKQSSQLLNTPLTEPQRSPSLFQHSKTEAAAAEKCSCFCIPWLSF